MLSMIYALLCVMLPCTIYMLFAVRRLNTKDNLLRHMIWVYIFLLYIYLAFSVAGIGSIWDIGHYETIIRVEEINLIPFYSKGAMTYILNLIMFLPLGFLLPLIWKNFRKPMKTLLAGAGFSLAIEICQLFNRRSTDIDDLLMNTLGAVLGYLVWVLFHKIFRKAGEKAISISSGEPVIYLVLATLGEFLLYNWWLFI